MRKVTLYEVTQRSVVADNPHSVQVFSHDMVRSLPDGDIAVAATFNDLPIHQITQQSGGFRTDAYIAMSNDLREMLELPFLGKIAEAEYKARCAERRAERADEHRLDMARRVDRFNATSWWHRIWFVLKGGVV